MTKKVARLSLWLVAFIWGMGYVVTSVALDYMTPLQTLALRFTLAFLILLVVNLRNLSDITKKDLKYGAAIGTLMFFGFVAQTIGLAHTTTSKSAFLTATSVVFVPILGSIINKQPLKKDDVLGSVLALSGIAIISLTSGFSNFNFGDILTLFCAALFAMQTIITTKAVREASSKHILLIKMAVSAVLSWIGIAIAGEWIHEFPKQGIGSILYLSLFSTLIAYAIKVNAQKAVSSSETAVIVTTESLFGTVASALILKEAITWRMVVGGLLIILGVLAVELKPIAKNFKKLS